MKYISKLIITKNRARIITSSKPLEVGYENDIEKRSYSKATQGEKSDYSYKRALDNLVLTIDSNITEYSKFITLTFANPVLDYDQSMIYLKTFVQNFKRIFNFKLRYSRISERQLKRGRKENNKGSWHFHLLVYLDNFLDFQKLKKCWPYGSVDLKSVDNIKNLSRYFGKYFTKQKSDLAINKKLVSHSQGLKQPQIIYTNEITAFSILEPVYEKSYSYFYDQEHSKTIDFDLKEYDISQYDYITNIKNIKYQILDIKY